MARTSRTIASLTSGIVTIFSTSTPSARSSAHRYGELVSTTLPERISLPMIRMPAVGMTAQDIEARAALQAAASRAGGRRVESARGLSSAIRAVGPGRPRRRGHLAARGGAPGRAADRERLRRGIPLRALRRARARGRERAPARGRAGGAGQAPEPRAGGATSRLPRRGVERSRGDGELLVGACEGGGDEGHPDRARDGRRRRREHRRDRRALPARRGRRLRDPLVRQHLRLRRHDARRPGRARDPDRRDRHRRRPHPLASPRLHGAAGALDAGGRARALRAGPRPQPPARDREPARALLRAPGPAHARVRDAW